ncbi:MAG: hypothetical protein ACJ72N_11275 [Labedaea sp.]
MEWTTEAIRAEVDRRHEVAKHSALVRQVRASRQSRPSWWRRLRSPERGDESAAGRLRGGLRFGSDSAA